MGENWKDIPGYEGLYQASDLGRIRSAHGKVTRTAWHGERVWASRIIKPRGEGYNTGKRAQLWKDGKPKDWLQARLVALTWVEGYEEGLTVNHKNGFRMDNRAENLEWVSIGDNIRHGFRIGLYESIQKRVMLVRNESGFIMGFESYSEASRFLKKNNGYIHTRIKRGMTKTNEVAIIAG